METYELQVLGSKLRLFGEDRVPIAVRDLDMEALQGLVEQAAAMYSVTGPEIVTLSGNLSRFLDGPHAPVSSDLASGSTLLNLAPHTTNARRNVPQAAQSWVSEARQATRFFSLMSGQNDAEAPQLDYPHWRTRSRTQWLQPKGSAHA